MKTSHNNETEKLKQEINRIKNILSNWDQEKFKKCLMDPVNNIGILNEDPMMKACFLGYINCIQKTFA